MKGFFQGLLGFAILGTILYLICTSLLLIPFLLFIAFGIYIAVTKAPVAEDKDCPSCNKEYKNKQNDIYLFRDENEHPLLSGHCYDCIAKDENLLLEVLKLNKDYFRKVEIHQRRKLKDRALYNLYLSTKAWEEKRQLAFDHYGKFCSRCRAKSYLEVHHNHYKTFGDENVEDLSILCKHCHSLVHSR